MEQLPLQIKKESAGYTILFRNDHGLEMPDIVQIFSRFGPPTRITQARNNDIRGMHFVSYRYEFEAQAAVAGLRMHPMIKLGYHFSKVKTPPAPMVPAMPDPWEYIDSSTVIDESLNDTYYFPENRNLYEVLNTSWLSNGGFDQGVPNHNNDDWIKWQNQKREEVRQTSIPGSMFTPSCGSTWSSSSSVNNRSWNDLEQPMGRLPLGSMFENQRRPSNDSLSNAFMNLNIKPNWNGTTADRDNLRFEVDNAGKGAINNNNVAVEVAKPRNSRKENIPRGSVKTVYDEPKKERGAKKKRVYKDAEEVIVANIHPTVSHKLIWELMAQHEPLAMTEMQAVPGSDTLYCHLYFESRNVAMQVENEFDQYDLRDLQLLVLRPCRLIYEDKLYS